MTPIETLDELVRLGAAHVEAITANDWDCAKDIVVERHKLLSGVLDGLVDDSRALHAIAAKCHAERHYPTAEHAEFAAEILTIINQPSRPVGPEG